MADTLQKLANQALVKMGEAGEIGGALYDRARAIDLSRVQDGIKALDVGAKLALAGQGARILARNGKKYPLAVAAAVAVATAAAAAYFIKKQREEEAAANKSARRIAAPSKAAAKKSTNKKATNGAAPRKRAAAKKASTAKSDASASAAD